MHRGANRDRRPARPRRMTGLVFRSIPEGHQGITDELVDRAALCLDGRAQHAEMTVQKVSGVLRRHGRGHSGESDDVREHDGQFPLVRPRDA